MNVEMLIERIYHHKGLRICAHILFWVVLFLISWYTTSISFNSYNSFNSSALVLVTLAGTFNQVVFYYPFVYFILPCLLKQHKYVIGILATVALLLLYTGVNTANETWIMKCESCMQVLRTNNSSYYKFLQLSFSNRMFLKFVSLGVFFGLLFSVCIPLSIKFALQAFRQQIASVKLAKQNVELEFDFLKSQVNPHFLFNSLNNIYGLILTDENEKAASVVARLSEFMRYSLYYSTADKMSLAKEIRLLKDYIELESIRLNHTKVNVDVQHDDDDHLLPALLLMPIVENAFKYTSDSAVSFIDLKIIIKDKTMYFTITNTIDENRQLQSAGGIGLQNLKKRLSLYYPGKHQYNISATDHIYSAKMTINL